MFAEWSPFLESYFGFGSVTAIRERQFSAKSDQSRKIENLRRCARPRSSARILHFLTIPLRACARTGLKIIKIRTL